MPIQLKPYSDFIIIEPVEESLVTDMGLEIPDNADKTKPRVGTVIEIGKDVTFCKIGEKVVYSPYTGESLIMQVSPVESKEFKVIREDALIALYIELPNK